MRSAARFPVAAALVAACGAIGFAADAAAQCAGSPSAVCANIAATATVTGGNAVITVAGTNTLDFGTVTAGTSQSPASLTANGGRWSISGQSAATVNITLATLPTALVGPSSATIPVSFSSTDLSICSDASCTTVTGTDDPHNPGPVTLSGSGAAYIGLMGTVSPPANAINGVYTGSVRLSVWY